MTFANTHARSKDPDTSQASAAAAETIATAHKSKIYAVLKSIGPLTGHQIAPHAGIDAHRVMKRTADLAREGVIEDSGERRPTPSGRYAIVWRISKRGREAMAVLAAQAVRS